MRLSARKKQMLRDSSDASEGVAFDVDSPSAPASY